MWRFLRFLLISGLFIASLRTALPQQNTPVQDKVKPPKSSKSDTEQDAEQGGLLYGDNWAYTILAPKGWIMDDELAASLGMSVLFYRKGESWEHGDATMYVNVIAKTKSITLKKVMESDVAEFKHRHPTLPISRSVSLLSADHQTVPTCVFGNVNKRTASERVAYVDTSKIILMVVLSAQTKAGYDHAVADHTALVRTIAFMDKYGPSSGKQAKYRH